MTQIFKNYLDFLNRTDKKVNGVSEEFAKENPKWKKENEKNEGCWNCSDCSRCSGCSWARNKKEVKNNAPDAWRMNIPVIENIHQAVLNAITDNGNKLNMGDWHTCDTTHCRGGWATFLAGEAGKKLESETSTLFAAMQIYKASSKIKVSPVRFFETNEVALKDIERCAEEEKKLSK